MSHYDLPEVVRPSPPHFHHGHPFDLKDLDAFPHQPTYAEPETTIGTSRWSSMKRSRRYWLIAGVVLLVLIMAGAIAGGILGSDLANKDSHDGSDDNSSADPTSTAGPTPSGIPSGGDSDGNQSQPHDSSRLAIGYGGTSASNFRLVLLQDTDGDLSAIEWRGSRSDHYKIKDRFDGDSSRLGQPVDNSPLSIVKYGPDGDLHLFYFTKELRFSHLIRRAPVASGENGSWTPGSLTAGNIDVPSAYLPSRALRLCAVVLPADWTGLDEDSILLMYWTSEGKDTVAMFSSTDPETRSSWQSRTFSLGTKWVDLEPHPTSSGFLMMAIQRPAESDDEGGADDGGMVGGVRLIWDLNDESRKKTFAILDCTYAEDNSLNFCRKIENTWTDTEAETIVLDARKPLLFSSRSFEANDTPDNSTRHLMRILDSAGQLTELLWDDGAWAGHEAFEADRESLPPGATSNIFKHVASGDDSLLYAVSESAEGGVMEFASDGSWWIDGQGDSEWRFIDYV